METLEKIRSDLKEIRYYYSRKAMFDEMKNSIAVNRVLGLVRKYNEAVKDAPPRLYDIYICLYVKNYTQEGLSIELNYTPNYIQMLNKKLLLYKLSNIPNKNKLAYELQIRTTRYFIMKGAVIYARYSSEKQNEQSIEGQLRICNQYAEANNLTILDTYIDRAMTGTNDNRPAFQQMLADCEKHVLWDIVLVYAIDRFGRNSIEIAVNKQKLKKNHKTLISATQRTSENIDGSRNLDGILLENVYIGLAEYYSAELSQKVKRGMHETLKKGLFPGGSISYGYKLENRKIIIDEEQAKIVVYLFQQYSQGVVGRELIDELKVKGITKNGKPIPLNTLYNMLHDEKYIGIFRYGGEIYTNIYPPIVPASLFEEVGIILIRNKQGGKSRNVVFMLKDKLICGYCGNHLQGDSGTSHTGAVKYYYKCMGRKKLNICDKSILPKETLENLVVDITLKVFGTPENISAIADKILDIHEERIQDKSILILLNEERAAINKSLSNIMKAIEQGIVNSTTKSRMDELEAQLSDIGEKIAIEQCREQNRLKKEEIINYLTETIKQKPNLLIRKLIQKIIVYDDKLEIYYNYTKHMPHPSADPDDNNRDFNLNCSSDNSPLSSPTKLKAKPFPDGNGFAFKIYFNLP